MITVIGRADVGGYASSMPAPSLSMRRVLLEAYRDFQEDRAPSLGAALAYYTIFSVAPLLIIVISIAGIVFGEEAVRGELYRQISNLVGGDGAKFIQDAVASVSNEEKSIAATITGMVVLFLGATGVFIQLQDALNAVWNVRHTASGFFSVLLLRWTSFTMVLGIGFLLLVSLFLSALIALVSNLVPESLLGVVFTEVTHFALTFLIITFLFALMYRVLPGVRLAWRDVWFGAALTAGLFVAGKTLLGIYLGRAAVGSTYGAAGTAIVLLVWVYYSSQILLFGAECTQVVTRLRGRELILRPGYAFDPCVQKNEGSA